MTKQKQLSDKPALTPEQAYLQALAAGFKVDAAQHAAVASLERCYQELKNNVTNTKGVYLYGPVGRGKTWLMDRFYASLTIPARRQHFHHFMRWVHQRLFQLTGQENPLTLLAQELAQDVRVLCFDELFVSDIGDAILISGLLQELFAQGLVLWPRRTNTPTSFMKMVLTANAYYPQ